MPALNKVELFDGKMMGARGYNGRWVVNVGPFTMPPGVDPGVAELDFALVIPSGPMAGEVVAFYIGNDGDTNPASNMTGGFVFDSAAPPAWSSYSGSYMNLTLADWDSQTYPDGPATGTDVQVYDGGYDNNVDIGFEIDVDPSSSPDWWRPPDPPPQVTGITTASLATGAATATLTVPLPAHVAGDVVLVGLSIQDSLELIDAEGDGGAFWAKLVDTNDSGARMTIWGGYVGIAPATEVAFTVGGTPFSMAAIAVVVPQAPPSIGLGFLRGTVFQIATPVGDLEVGTRTPLGSFPYSIGHRAYWMVWAGEYAASAGAPFTVDAPFDGVLAEVDVAGHQRVALLSYPTGDSPPLDADLHGVNLTKIAVFAIPETDAAPPAPPVPPTVSGLSPHLAAVGDLITVTGTHFAGVTLVVVGPHPVAYTVVSPTEITFVCDGHYGQVTVTTVAGSATSPDLLYRRRTALASGSRLFTV